jgi:HSP20 family protein
MTRITRFVPIRPSFNEIAALQSRLNAIFQEVAQPATGAQPATVAQPEEASPGSFVPPVDIYDQAQTLVLKLEIPGVKLEDLDVHLENQILTVQGERKLEAGLQQENFHRIERRFGSFVRTFTLPETLDPEALTASYDAGVLTIAVARKAEAKPRQVKIEVTTPAATSIPAA